MEHSTEDPGVDLAALRAELASSGGIHNDTLRRESVARVSAAALLDIAFSLRTLAAEASLAMLGSGAFVDAVDEEDVVDEDGRGVLLVGDIVRCLDEDEAVRVVTGVGVTEGDLYADVALDGDASNARRAWQRDLERVPGASVAVASRPDLDEDNDEDDDDDFTAPASALDALRDLEKKPAKKKGKKS